MTHAEVGGADSTTDEADRAGKPGPAPCAREGVAAAERTLDELDAAIYECDRVLGDGSTSCADRAKACDRLVELWTEVVRGPWTEIQPFSARLLLSNAAAEARRQAREDARFWRQHAERETASTGPVPA